MKLFSIILLTLLLHFNVHATTHYHNIQKIQCDRGQGTAFQIENGDIISAAHVNESNNHCTWGQSETVLSIKSRSTMLDFVSYTSEASLTSTMKYSCNRLSAGEEITVYGYPFGTDILYGSKGEIISINNQTGVAFIDATVLPGMSGGPAIDNDGTAIGWIHGYVENHDIAVVFLFRNLYVCS